ncbi:hypothetical protein [Psychromonas ossibalaenae]|uniref:hypothetical protein n=1 Tax=Psychromonas ossibalaenae TaxID=444922 RepID=UPI000361F0E3|nr:hypothetical protein [Psychromonas ossibalaenae]
MSNKHTSKSTKSDDISLDDLLVNLQKSLSRVSARSGDVPDDQSRSLIYGDVDFSIELKVDGEQDKLQVRKDGAVKLSISGKISIDIRDEEIE